MSHATCMVLGPKNEEELEEALAPFDENILVDPYLREITEYGMNQREEGETLETFAARMSELWEERWVVEDGKVWSESTYNPLSKWDWWVIGGRWRGCLPMKEGRSGLLGEPGSFDNDKMYENGADVALLGDIDWDVKRAAAKKRAVQQWAAVQAGLNGRSLPTPPGTAGTREEWDAWRDDICVKAVMKKLDDHWMTPDDLVEMLASRDRHLERAVAGAAPAFATLVPGEGWLVGRMGWFGMSTDNGESRDEYHEKVNKILDSMPDDTMVWMIDFHI